MKKAARIIARIVLVILLLAGIAAVACFDTVDYSPYVKSSYYQQTTSRLTATAATNELARGNLFAGFGKAKLTPPLDKHLPLAGYGNRHGKPATGVHDDLFVKAAAIRVGARTGVMFGCDALIVPREVSDAATAQIQQQFGLRREQLYFSASHTHSSLGGWGEGIVGEMFAGKFDPTARAIFVDAIVNATKEALTDLKPAEFGAGHFTAREFIRNRLVGDLGKVDPEFSYIILKQTNGRTGVLGSYSAHATVLSGANFDFSADYPGAWQRAVEQATGGIAIFLAGGVGSHGPVPCDKGFAGTQCMGDALARKTLDELPKTTLTNSIAFSILAADIAMPPLNTRITDSIRLRPWLTKKLLPPMQDSFTQGFRLDHQIWLSTPCDYSGELVIRIKDMLRVRGFDGAVTSFNGDYIGYVIPSRYYHLDGYEPRTMSFYGPNVPDYLDELVRTIAVDLAEAR